MSSISTNNNSQARRDILLQCPSDGFKISALNVILLSVMLLMTGHSLAQRVRVLCPFALPALAASTTTSSGMSRLILQTAQSPNYLKLSAARKRSLRRTRGDALWTASASIDEARVSGARLSFITSPSLFPLRNSDQLSPLTSPPIASRPPKFNHMFGKRIHALRHERLSQRNMRRLLIADSPCKRICTDIEDLQGM